MRLQNMMQRMWMGWMGMLMVVVLWSPAQGETLEQALDMVNAEAPMVVVIPNMQGFSDHWIGFGKTLGIENAASMNMLDELKEQTGVTNGVKWDGPVVVVFLESVFLEKQKERIDAKEQGTPEGVEDGHHEPNIGVLLAITDEQAFLSQFSNVQKTGDVVTATAKKADQHSYPVVMKLMNGFVLLGDPDKGSHESYMGAVKNYVPAKAGEKWLASLGAKSRKTITQMDVVALFDLAKMSPNLLPIVKNQITKMDQQVQMAQEASTGDNSTGIAFGRAMMKMYGQAAVAAIRDGQAGALGVTVSNQVGVDLMQAIQFKPDSAAGKIFSHAEAGAAKLNVLANQPGLLRTAVNLNGIDVPALVQDVENALQGESMGPAADAMKVAIPPVKNTKALSQAVYVNSQAKMGSALFTGVTVEETSDPAARLQSQQAYLQAMAKIRVPLSAPAGEKNAAGGPAGGSSQGTTPAEEEAITYITSYTPNAMTVEGVSVDAYSWQMQLPQSAMQGNPMMPLMMMLGATGQSGYIAKVDDSHVVIITTPDVATLGATIRAVKSGSGLVNDAMMAQAREQFMPEGAFLEGYVDVGGLVGLANMFTMMTGQPPMQAPTGLPLVSVGASLKDSGLVIREHIPMQVITFVKSKVDEMQNPPAQSSPQGGNTGGPPGVRRRRGGAGGGDGMQPNGSGQ